MAGSNDFFLQFGSDAAPFSEELVSGLTPGIAKINELRAALAEYDEQVTRSSGGGGPLGISFQGLDESSARLERAAQTFSQQIGRALVSVGEQVTKLEQLLARAGSSRPSRPTGSNFSPEQEEILAQQRRGGAGSRNATQVTPADQASADHVRRSAEAGAKAVQSLALANEALARSSAALTTGLGGLDARLVSLLATAGRVSELPTSASSGAQRFPNVSEIQVGNTQANPVPVVLVGGEPHPAGGHPKGAQPPRTATSATSTARAREEMEAVVSGPRTLATVQTDLDNLRRELDNAQRSRRRLRGDDDDPRVPQLDQQINALTARRTALQSERESLRNAPQTSREAVNVAGANSEPARRRVPIVVPEAGTARGVDTAARDHAFAQLDTETRDILNQAKAQIAAITGSGEAEQAARRESINRAGAAFQGDSQYRQLFQSAEQRRGAFSDYLGLDSSQPATRAYIREALKRGGSAEDYALRQAQRRDAVDDRTPAGDASSESARAARINEIAGRTARPGATAGEVAAQSRLNEALLAQEIAQNRVNELLTAGAGKADQLGRAQIALSSATRAAAVAAEQQSRAEAQAQHEPNAFQRITGRQTSFGNDLLRHGTNALENTIGYALVFTGFEKLRELVHDGIEAQAAFTRLQASLDANGISAGNLRGQLADISATTATPIEHVIEAASELSGTLKSSAEIEFGARISSQLANISQGTLTAKEAAVGLRDVIAAYGDQWGTSQADVQSGIQRTGDQIAHLSQLTGVSIKDITEGTTQIAQEANEFGLNQRQAATLAAYVTKGTGETGEQAASQTSRLLSTLYNGRVQTTLQRINGPDGKPIATEQEFQQGKIGDVLQNLIGNYRDLTPPQRQQIASLMGTGITARAFSALVSGGQTAANELSGVGSNDTGALARQNQQYLTTVAGAVKQLDEDFQNLGNTLQRLGAFDSIGVLAKSLDELLKTVRQVFDEIASVMDSNPLTAGILHWSAILLEAAAAWKLFGGAATRALQGAGLLNLTPTNAAQIQQAQATPGGIVPAPQYGRASFRTAATGVTTGAGGLAGRLFNRISLQPAEGQSLRSALAQNLSQTTGLNRLRGQDGGLFSGVRGRLSSLRGSADNTITSTQAANGLRAVGSAATTTAEEVTQLGRTALSEVTDIDLLGRAALVASSQLETLGVSATEAAAINRVAAEGTAVTQAGLGVRLAAFGAGLGASLASLTASLGLMALIVGGLTEIEASIADAKQRYQGQTNLLDGSTSQQDFEATQPKSGAAGFRNYYLGNSRSITGSLGNAFLHTGQGVTHLLTGGQVFSGRSGDGPSQQSSDRVTQLMSQVYGDQQNALPGTATTQAVKDWIDSQTAGIEAQRAAIQKAGGNDRNAQAQIAYNINQMEAEIKDAGQRRIDQLNGLAGVDDLSLSQTSLVLQAASSLAQLNNQTLRANPNATRTVLDQAGIASGSKAYAALQGEAGLYNTTGLYNGRIGKFDGHSGEFVDETSAVGRYIGPSSLTNLPKLIAPTLQGRLGAQRDVNQIALNNAVSKIQGGNLNPDQLIQAQQQRDQALQAIQQANTALLQNPIAVSNSRSQLSEATGGTTAGGDNRAVQFLQQANRQIQTYNATLDKTDPQFWQNLAEIQQNKQHIAQLQSNPQIQALMVQAAGTADQVAQASLALQQAQAQLAADSSGGASSATIASDRAGIAAKNLAIAQASQAVTEASNQASTQGIRNDIIKAQSQLNNALQRENVYAQSALADGAAYQQAKQQEIQARQAIADATQAQTQAEYDVTSAYQKIHGDSVGASQTALNKANQQYRYAVQQYGKDSQQAYAALAGAVQAQGELTVASLAQVNSFLDLDIALLNARGQSGDDVRASNDAVAKARNAINSYLRSGGKQGTEQYNQLMGQLASAQRTAFDTALQAQLDTLDFQQQTYQITSAQEVASLQQILKNKQLTLKEQRDITLKIKSLQDSIRQQLTEGGLNIPSSIKLPTAYEVRRSLGSGFGGAATQVNTVNNNQQVVINNNVPNAQVATAIANSVINLINQQTSMGLRASSSTPRTVATR